MFERLHLSDEQLSALVGGLALLIGVTVAVTVLLTYLAILAAGAWAVVRFAWELVL